MLHNPNIKLRVPVLDGTEWRRTLTTGFLPQPGIIEGESPHMMKIEKRSESCCCYCAVVVCSIHREAANKALNATGQDHINMETLYQARMESFINISGTEVHVILRQTILRTWKDGDNVWICNRVLFSRFCHCFQCVTGKENVFCSLCSHFSCKESHDC